MVFLGNHCRKLLAVKQACERPNLSENEIIREIKAYVMKEEGHSISKIDRWVEGEVLKKQIKQLVIAERMVLMSIVSNVVSHHLLEML